jgi:transcriptional regulator with XRE-family HTH domain
METIQTRLKFLRTTRLKLTQPEFASRIGLKSASIVHHMESGSRKITDRTVKQICSEFNVNKEWLMSGIEPIFTLSVKKTKKTHEPHSVQNDHGISTNREEAEKIMNEFLVALGRMEQRLTDRIEKLEKRLMRHTHPFQEGGEQKAS